MESEASKKLEKDIKSAFVLNLNDLDKHGTGSRDRDNYHFNATTSGITNG